MLIVSGCVSGCGVYSDVTPPDPCSQRMVYPYEGALKADYEAQLARCHKREKEKEGRSRISKVIKF